MNFAFSVVKPDMHLNIISKPAPPTSKLFKDKLRLFQVTRRLLDSDVEPTIWEVNFLDSINYTAYKLSHYPVQQTRSQLKSVLLVGKMFLLISHTDRFQTRSVIRLSWMRLSDSDCLHTAPCGIRTKGIFATNSTFLVWLWFGPILKHGGTRLIYVLKDAQLNSEHFSKGSRLIRCG